MGVYSFRYLSTNGNIYLVTCISYEIKHGVLDIVDIEGNRHIYSDYVRMIGKFVKGERND